MASLRDGLAEAAAMMTLLESSDQPWSMVAADVRRALADSCERAGLRLEVVVEGPDTELSPAAALAVRRVVREALTNILKHARARNVSALLRATDDSILVRIDDDGVGVGETTPSGGGRGLGILVKRVERIGGRTRFGPRPGGGWSIEASFPTQTKPSHLAS